MWESLFNSEYCEIFKSAYFVEHLQTNASENVFMKLILPQVSSAWMSETSLWIVFHDWFPVKFLFTYNISLNKRRSKFQKKNMSCERALIFDQWKTFSENYKPMIVWLWPKLSLSVNHGVQCFRSIFLSHQLVYRRWGQLDSYFLRLHLVANCNSSMLNYILKR